MLNSFYHPKVCTCGGCSCLLAGCQADWKPSSPESVSRRLTPCHLTPVLRPHTHLDVSTDQLLWGSSRPVGARASCVSHIELSLETDRKRRPQQLCAPGPQPAHTAPSPPPRRHPLPYMHTTTHLDVTTDQLLWGSSCPVDAHLVGDA